MCGRGRDPTEEEISQIKLNPFTGQLIWNWKAQPRRYNIAPSLELPVIRAKDGNRYVDPMQWGLSRHGPRTRRWPSPQSMRADSVATKPAFRDAWAKGRRCLVITGGFYEWRKVDVADKQPFAIGMGNGGVMAMAGLWAGWKDRCDPNAEWLRTFTIITTELNDLIAPVHDRMPVILGFEDWPKWLGEEPANENELKALLRPFPSERLAMCAVDRKIGNVKNDGPELIERIAA
jgi:putative SOS response-associated peptidase YedK